MESEKTKTIKIRIESIELPEGVSSEGLGCIIMLDNRVVGVNWPISGPITDSNAIEIQVDSVQNRIITFSIKNMQTENYSLWSISISAESLSAKLGEIKQIWLPLQLSHDDNIYEMETAQFAIPPPRVWVAYLVGDFLLNGTAQNHKAVNDQEFIKLKETLAQEQQEHIATKTTLKNLAASYASLLEQYEQMQTTLKNESQMYKAKNTELHQDISAIQRELLAARSQNSRLKQELDFKRYVGPENQAQTSSDWFQQKKKLEVMQSKIKVLQLAASINTEVCDQLRDKQVSDLEIRIQPENMNEQKAVKKAKIKKPKLQDLEPKRKKSPKRTPVHHRSNTQNSPSLSGQTTPSKSPIDEMVKTYIAWHKPPVQITKISANAYQIGNLRVTLHMVKENILVKYNKEAILLDVFVKDLQITQKMRKQKQSNDLSRDSLERRQHSPEPTPVKQCYSDTKVKNVTSPIASSRRAMTPVNRWKKDFMPVLRK